MDHKVCPEGVQRALTSGEAGGEGGALAEVDVVGLLPRVPPPRPLEALFHEPHVLLSVAAKQLGIRRGPPGHRHAPRGEPLGQ
eukprot:4914167-Pyramimonas_sp.AAC.1